MTTTTKPIDIDQIIVDLERGLPLLMTREQLSELTGLSVSSWARRDSQGRGMPHVKVADGRSGRVRYPRAVVLDWLRAHLVGEVGGRSERKYPRTDKYRDEVEP